MDVELITMEKSAAQAKLDAYRAQLQHEADTRYEAAAAGYRALAAGLPLLNLTDAIVGAGLGADNRPRLAVARADQFECWVECNSGSIVFGTNQRWRTTSIDSTLRRIIPHQWPTDRKQPDIGWALVPMVPADKLPRVNTDLSVHFILWEVEQWASRSHRARPDRDPYLLKHIGGDLYAVLAEWDLTELERAVMVGQNRN